PGEIIAPTRDNFPSASDQFLQGPSAISRRVVGARTVFRGRAGVGHAGRPPPESKRPQTSRGCIVANEPVPAKGLSILGLLAFLLGVVAIPVAIIACLGIISLPFSPLGAILGFLGIVV